MKRPVLNQVGLSKAFQTGCVTVTMDVGAWDALLQASYDQGFCLVEMDKHEIPVRAFRKPLDA